MIGDIASFLSLLNDLAVRKSGINREYFEGFIEPIWLAFTEVHEDYKESLQKYRDLLLSRENPIRILHEINFDSCLTSDLRVKLEINLNGIKSKKNAKRRKMVYDFVTHILNYFDCNYQRARAFEVLKENQYQPDSQCQLGKKDREVITNQYGLSDLSRRAIIENSPREGIFDSIARRLDSPEGAVLVIQFTLDHLQDSYRCVAESYFKIRQELLQ
ncbi:hypothetical protein [Microcystis sp. BLCC-F210]|uniref:hypothetical protein n=1 Tax=Microcystis sp. BLCC-F210 TaxID=3342751 RepID=UPI0035C902F6